MMTVHGRLFVEPGEMELLARAAQEQAQRLLWRQSARSLSRGLILEQLSTELAQFLADPNPPVYTIAPATNQEVQTLAALLAEDPQATAHEPERHGSSHPG